MLYFLFCAAEPGQPGRGATMQLGIIGLGRMGANIARRLMCGGHERVVFDIRPQSVSQLVAEGAVGANSIADLVAKLKAPRAVWMMLPAAIVDVARLTVPIAQAFAARSIGGGSHSPTGIFWLDLLRMTMRPGARALP
jgi:UDP-N-acetylmuramoylalanine-D-glutamate ligase